MEPFDTIEKLINEHGSATIISHHLAFVKEQHIALQGQVSDLQREIGNFQAKLEAVTLDRNQKQHDLQRLQEEHTEEIRIHNAIEFRRGKRTGGQWLPFCPKCHMPAQEYADHTGIECSAQCGWISYIKRNIDSLISQL